MCTVTQCEVPNVILLHPVKGWIGLLLMMFGINRSLQRCLSGCGAFFAIEFQRKTIWLIEVFSICLTRLVQLGVVHLNRLRICFSIAMLVASFGLRYWPGFVFILCILVNFDINLLSSLRWVAWIDLSICSSQLFGLQLFGWFERNNRVFQNTISNPYSLIEKVKLNSFLWLKSKQVTFAYNYHDWWKHLISCMGVMM